MKEIKETNYAWKILIDSLNSKDEKIIELQKIEIELLQRLMETEENIKELIKVIAEKQFPEKESITVQNSKISLVCACGYKAKSLNELKEHHKKKNIIKCTCEFQHSTKNMGKCKCYYCGGVL